MKKKVIFWVSLYVVGIAIIFGGMYLAVVGNPFGAKNASAQISEVVTPNNIAELQRAVADSYHRVYEENQRINRFEADDGTSFLINSKDGEYVLISVKEPGTEYLVKIVLDTQGRVIDGFEKDNYGHISREYSLADNVGVEYRADYEKLAGKYLPYYFQYYEIAAG